MNCNPLQRRLASTASSWTQLGLTSPAGGTTTKTSTHWHHTLIMPLRVTQCSRKTRNMADGLIRIYPLLHLNKIHIWIQITIAPELIAVVPQMATWGLFWDWCPMARSLYRKTALQFQTKSAPSSRWHHSVLFWNILNMMRSCLRCDLHFCTVVSWNNLT